MFASATQGDDPAFVRWLGPLAHPDLSQFRHNRKLWEWCTILETFDRSGLMQAGSSALAFGVGQERLPAILASRGVRVLATDQPIDGGAYWSTTGQHSSELAQLRADDVCPPDVFERLVSFRPVDMNALPHDLSAVDLVWSSCAFEHLGSPGAGIGFVLDSLRYIAPGGVAVHTTEVRVDGGPDVEVDDHTVLYSVESMRSLVAEVARAGFDVIAGFDVPWDTAADRFVDEYPYRFEPAHLKLRIGQAITSSFAVVIGGR